MATGDYRHICRKMPGVDMDGLCRFLRRVHPRGTPGEVEATTGISAGTVENWLCGKSTPSLAHFGLLMSVYGPSLVAATFTAAPRWLDDAHRAERLRKLTERRAKDQEEIDRLTGG